MSEHILIATSAHHAGDTRITYRQAQSLSKKFDVSLIARPPLSDTLPEGIHYHFLPEHASLLYRVFYTGLKIAQLLLLHDINVVIIHDPELVPWSVLLSAFGVKVIVDHHENYYALLKRKQTNVFSTHVLSKLLQLNQNILQHNVALNIAATPSIKYSLEQQGLTTLLFPNYAGESDLEVPHSPKPLTDTPIDLIYIGYGSEQRGLLAILDVVAWIDQHHNTTLNCHIAGLIRPVYEYHKAISHPAWKHITYHGFVSRKLLSTLLPASKIGLCPYLEDDHHRESLPNKIFEYSRAGCAVVGHTLQQWRFIEEKEMGILTDFTNTEVSANQILALINNASRLNTFRENSFAASRNEFNYQQIERDLLDHISEVIQSTR